MFTPEFFSGNRAALRKAVAADFIILSASGLIQKTADETFPLRQDSNFWYLTGLQIADAMLVIDVKTGEAVILLPTRAKHRDLWEGAIDASAITMTSGIKKVLSADEATEFLKNISSSKPKIGTIVPDSAYIAAYGMHISPVKITFRNRLRRMFGTENLVDVRKDMARLRQVKQPVEIAAIQRAIDITLESLASLKSQIASMKNERDVDIYLTHQFRLRGAASHAYDPIVASGIHSATIHHQTNDGPLIKNGLLLMDVGASFGGYAADISRTWVTGTPNTRQRAAFDVIKSTHSYAISLLKPGVIIREYQKQVVAFQVNLLIKAGFYMPSERTEREKSYPQLISHFLGLDVHDAGMYDEPLQTGVVLTVEPGFYLPEEAIGIRIEDDILITTTGAENLSVSLPDNLLYLS